jgi:N-acetylmuramoyl-L-alanine amidase
MILALGVRAWAAPATIDRIEVRGDRGAVTLHLSAPVQARASALGASGEAPDRIYLDLPGVSLGHGAPTVVPGTGNVVRVRTGQFDTETTRVVLDLGHAEPFALRVKGSTIVVEVGSAHLAPPRTFARARPGPPSAVAVAPAVAKQAPPVAKAEPSGPEPAPVMAAAPPPAAPPQPLPALPPVPREIEGPPPPPAQTRVAAAPTKKALPPPSLPTFPLPVVVLDAGHGGRDPGAEGIGGVQEKDIALLITQRLAARLPTRIPAIVVLTRADDSFVSIERRLAVPGDATSAFISLHANASSDPSLHGVEIFYGGGSVRTADASGASPQSVSLGRFLGDALRPRVELLRRPRPGDFGVLVRNRVPSALVEIGYLTHPEEGVRAQDPAYHDMLADALADGIAAFLRGSAARL